MSIVRRFRAKRLAEPIREQRHFYETRRTGSEKRDWQLQKFNEIWGRIGRNVRYFKELKERKGLPDCFSSWQEFKSLLPHMNRKLLQESSEDFLSSSRTPHHWTATGGSTGEPIQLPNWKSESSAAAADMWYARSWYDVSPADKLFLIWGHSHLLGDGISGWFRGQARRIKDEMLGYYRHSAYDMSETALRDAGRALLRFQPDYVIAYSVALDRFSKINAKLGREFREIPMKIAIATGEGFPSSDSARRIEDTLGCPVVMEYGSVETGPIAHQKPNGKFSVFWRHHFLEAVPSRYGQGRQVLLTSLYERCLPLVRYRLGDIVKFTPGEDGFELEAVIGRSNDYVVLEDGAYVHSEAFSHVVRESASILSYQIVQKVDGTIDVNYVAPSQLNGVEESELRRRLRKINENLESVQFVRVDKIGPTVAGKAKRILRQEKPGS